MNKTMFYGVTVVVSALLSIAEVHAAPKTYEVTVQSSFDQTFTDCFRFDTPGVGDLTIDALGRVLTYRKGELGTVGDRFKAVTRDDDFEIMFFGRFRNRGTLLEGGEAVSEFGGTFVFLGSKNKACSLGASTGSASDTNPYGR